MNTVLLVEDNDNNANILEDMFAFDDVPAKLVTVVTGEDALRAAAEIQPALILMDLRLPGLDGLETTQLLKGNPLTKNIPVWAITAYSMKGDKERAKWPGVASTSPSRSISKNWPPASADSCNRARKRCWPQWPRPRVIRGDKAKADGGKQTLRLSAFPLIPVPGPQISKSRFGGTCQKLRNG